MLPINSLACRSDAASFEGENNNGITGRLYLNATSTYESDENVSDYVSIFFCH